MNKLTMVSIPQRVNEINYAVKNIYITFNTLIILYFYRKQKQNLIAILITIILLIIIYIHYITDKFITIEIRIII